MYISIEVYRGDDNSFIAMCPELNLSSSANTEQRAVDSLKEEIIYRLYLGKRKFDDSQIKASSYFYVDGDPKVH